MITHGPLTDHYTIGIYLFNWGVPGRNEWETGIYLVKWYVGIKLYKELK